MATCRDIITLGLQLAAIVPLGRTPKAKESDLGLTMLQSLYEQMCADQIFGEMTDVYKDEDYTAQEYENIFADDATITIPQTIEDEDTGKTRVPRDLSAITVEANGVRQTYVYSGNDWETLFGLTLDSDAPLATRNKAGLASLFAMYFVDAFGGTIGPATQRNGFLFQSGISNTRKAPLPDIEYF